MTTGTITNHGSFESSKQTLIKDLKNVVSDANALINVVAAAGTEQFAQARSKLEVGLGQAKTRLVDARMAATEKARGTVDATNTYAREHPWKVLGVAAVAGAIIGTLLNRR